MSLSNHSIAMMHIAQLILVFDGKSSNWVITNTLDEIAAKSEDDELVITFSLTNEPQKFDIRVVIPVGDAEIDFCVDINSPLFECEDVNRALENLDDWIDVEQGADQHEMTFSWSVEVSDADSSDFIELLDFALGLTKILTEAEKQNEAAKETKKQNIAKAVASIGEL